MSSKDPVTTLQRIRSNKISLITFLDILEMLDVKDTIEEQRMKEAREEERRKSGGRG